jgi:protein TonB
MRPSSVLVSVVVHAAGLLALVVVPLLAYHDRPEVAARSMQYVRVQAPRLPRANSVPPPPTRVRAPSNPHAAPLHPPVGIAPERRVAPRDTEGVDGGLEPLSEPGVPYDGGIRDVGIPPPPPPPGPAAPLRIGGPIRPPQRVAYVAPRYPPLARTAGIQGDVQLEAIIGVDGTVEQLRVVRSMPLLDDAALDAVRQWRYTPTLLHGTPVPVVMTVTVSFRLR